MNLNETVWFFDESFTGRANDDKEKTLQHKGNIGGEDGEDQGSGQ